MYISLVFSIRYTDIIKFYVLVIVIQEFYRYCIIWYVIYFLIMWYLLTSKLNCSFTLSLGFNW